MRRFVLLARRGVSAATFTAGRRALRLGVLPSQVHQSTLRRTAPDVVVDAGANRGQFSLDVHRTRPRAVVHAFEPLTSEADVFEEIFTGVPEVNLHRVGLWSHSGPMEIHVSAAADSSSMLPIGDQQVSTFPGTEEVGRRPVEVVRLDEVLNPAQLGPRAMLKIDVQGGELEVLRGAGTLLDEFRWVYAELSLTEFYVGQPSAGEIIEYLRRSSFEVVDLTVATRHRGRAVQVDALFERQPGAAADH
jgi:FkbM family methyltransferase